MRHASPFFLPPPPSSIKETALHCTVEEDALELGTLSTKCLGVKGGREGKKEGKEEGKEEGNRREGGRESQKIKPLPYKAAISKQKMQTKTFQ